MSDEEDGPLFLVDTTDPCRVTPYDDHGRVRTVTPLDRWHHKLSRRSGRLRHDRTHDAARPGHIGDTVALSILRRSPETADCRDF
jgi:hypothetical protein